MSHSQPKKHTSLGYAVGAILTGIIADAFGINASILVIGLLTIGSAGIIFFRMRCLHFSGIRLFSWMFTFLPEKS